MTSSEQGATEQRYPCDCAEMFVDVMGDSKTRRKAKPRRLAETPLHSCAYIRRRNLLIPKACAEADEAVRAGDVDYASRGRVWTRAFVAAMGRLAAAEFGYQPRTKGVKEKRR